MNKEEYVSVITDREELYDKCENMEQLFDKYYLPLLDVHYRKTYDLQKQNKKYKQVVDKLKEEINSNMYGYDDGEDYGVDCCCDGFKLLDILKEVE